MRTNRLPIRAWVERFVLALLFVAIGVLIYFVFSPLRPIWDPVDDYLGRFGLIAILLVAAVLLGRSSHYRQYRPLFIGLVIMAVAVSLDWIFANYLIDNLQVRGNTPEGFAMLKLNECIVVFSVVITLTLLSGGSLGSIYLQKGNLKLGLTVGVITFLLAAAGSPFMAEFLFKAKDLTLARIIPWIPWVLILVLANAAQEELLFRGLFLRKLEPFFGKFLSNFLVFLVFSALHKGVNYTSDDLIFIAAVFPLALAWGYLMQKTDSIWGSVLFHAGMDIPIMLGIISNYP